jgi:hypothetical protein
MYEKMVLQNTPIIYTHPVFMEISELRFRAVVTGLTTYKKKLWKN